MPIIRDKIIDRFIQKHNTEQNYKRKYELLKDGVEKLLSEENRLKLYGHVAEHYLKDIKLNLDGNHQNCKEWKLGLEKLDVFASTNGLTSIRIEGVPVRIEDFHYAGSEFYKHIRGLGRDIDLEVIIRVME